MEYLKRICAFAKEISNSATRKENAGIFRISTCGAIYFGWHISDFHVTDIWIKGIFGFLTIVVGPSFSAFLNDLYKEKIKNKIFKDKHRY